MYRNVIRVTDVEDAAPGAMVLQQGRKLIVMFGVSGPVVTDAQLMQLALEQITLGAIKKYNYNPLTSEAELELSDGTEVDWTSTFAAADESGTVCMDDTAALADKRLFVHNVGWLMAQTRNGIAGARLIDEATAEIRFTNGAARRVNIEADSYAAILRDMAARMD